MVSKFLKLKYNYTHNYIMRIKVLSIKVLIRIV